MLTETKVYKGPDVTAAVPVSQPPLSRLWEHYLNRPAQFLTILAQFALIVVVVGQWQLESQLLMRVLWLAFIGFAIHHLLPLRFRLPFFALLSLGAVITGVGHLVPNVFAGWLGGRM